MRILVLFNLKAGVSADDYEHWAKTRDMPTVRSLPSIDEFRAYRVTGLLGSETPAPYGYAEVIDVIDMDGFFTDIGTPTMQEVSAEFQNWTDAPLFLMTSEVPSA
jgi:hypothetical protein